ncbi:MAG: hypothetical protein IKV47_03785 [Oscillospiraceae bacterium]|nr:hypothetical protein [Oscillospiraceae bacterium]
MHSRSNKRALTTKEIVVFAMLGSILFISKILMEWAPNIHFIGMLLMTYTLVYRKKALIPLYVFVLLEGVYAGFNLWWIPYVYIWLPLWGATMLLPKNMPAKVAVPVYMVVCGLGGLLYGTIYAPFQALAFGLSFKGMIAWIVAGLPFDVLHAAGNLAAGSLIYPLSRLIMNVEARSAK